MAENNQPLTHERFTALDGVADWRLLLGRLKARFAAPDLATAARFAARVGELPDADASVASLTVTASGVVVALGTSRATAADLPLARAISAAAAELGLTAEPGTVTQLELGLDTATGERLAPYYAALLGGTVENGEPVDPTGQVPTVWWQTPDDAEPEWALPEQPFEQRWHFDVWVAPDDAERRLQAVLDAGGRLVSDRAAPSFWVVEDADGNRSCICTQADRP